jgi:hypothetical protein
VFRTNVLAAVANPSINAFDHPDLYSESPSSSSTCAELSKVGAEKAYVTAMSLPQNLNGDRRIDTETFNFVEKKTKKRSLESSSSTSSSSSLSSNSVAESGIGTQSSAESRSDLKDDGENKENLILQPIDKEEMPAAIFNITFKFLNTETRLLRKILLGHGLSEACHDANDFNILWTGNQLKPDMLRSLSSYQRINHFPR